MINEDHKGHIQSSLRKKGLVDFAKEGIDIMDPLVLATEAEILETLLFTFQCPDDPISRKPAIRGLTFPARLNI